MAISVASTVVMLRVLADNNDLHTSDRSDRRRLAVVEDLFTILVLGAPCPSSSSRRGGYGSRDERLPGVVAGKDRLLLIAFAFIVGRTGDSLVLG